MSSGDTAKSLEMVKAGAELALRLMLHPLPTIGVMEGHAYPMGTFRLLACDVRLGARGEQGTVGRRTTWRQQLRRNLKVRHFMSRLFAGTACRVRSACYSAAALTSARSARTAQNLNSGILPNGSSAGLVNRLAAASA